MDRIEHKRYEVKVFDHEELWANINNTWLAAQADMYGDRFHDEEAAYICIYHGGRLISCYSDRIRAEGDAFRRDLVWVAHAFEQAYLLGFNDGLAGKFSKPPAAKPRRVKA